MVDQGEEKGGENEKYLFQEYCTFTKIKVTGRFSQEGCIYYRILILKCKII